jgi:pimeloyl-ACP methyl ester carboxylesterase
MLKTSFYSFSSDKNLAYLKSEGKNPAIVWLGGLRSDMTGSKAEALHQAASKAGFGFLRFDYSGHGQSSGQFADCVMSDWIDEAEAIINDLTSGPVILVGSSMGGWIGQILALRMAEKVQGLVLIAPATDMTEKLMWDEMSAEERAILARDGRIEEPSQYSPDPLVITKRLIDDGQQYGLLGKPIAISCPVRILQGDQDPDVPWQHGLLTHQAITSPDCEFILIKGGDHRLSRPQDIELLCETSLALAEAQSTEFKA